MLETISCSQITFGQDGIVTKWSKLAQFRKGQGGPCREQYEYASGYLGIWGKSPGFVIWSDDNITLLIVP